MIMLMLSTRDNIIEYKYTETDNCRGICEDMNWKPTTGEARMKQIKAVEDAYDYEHLINPKTKKPKKSYVFWHQIQEVELIDGRINNGGSNSNFPDEEFDYLLNCILFTGRNQNDYRQRNKVKGFEQKIDNDNIYLSNGMIFSEFGFDYYKYVNSIEEDMEDGELDCKAWKKFKEICYGSVRSNTIGRICKRYGYNKNNIPKGILRKQSKDDDTLIPDDDKLDIYDERWNASMKHHNIRWSDIANGNGYDKVDSDVQEEFENENIYGIKRYNKIVYTYDEYCEFYGRFDLKKKHECQKHFRCVVFDSIEGAITRRVDNPDNYKDKLDKEQQKKVLNYLGLLRNLVTGDNW